MSALSFEILKQDRDTEARLGLIKTRRGDIRTPYLVPVATLASVRALGSDDLSRLGVQCALANTYHLHLKPGDELIRRLGGLHKFMGFHGPLFSDSGRFQAFSLGFGREHNISKIGNIFPQELQCRSRSQEEEKNDPDSRNPMIPGRWRDLSLVASSDCSWCHGCVPRFVGLIRACAWAVSSRAVAC